MGQSQSNPSSASPDATTKHVFTASTPINFSAELVDSLANSSETNSTRAKALELHIAQRVHEELSKLQSSQDSAVEAARKKILSLKDEVEQTAEKSTTGTESGSSGGTVTDKIKSALPDSIGGASAKSDEEKRKQQTTKKVQDEIERLKKELGQRKVLKELPKSLESAREDVIGCLRVNDRRPLDCWKEVEVFKREVRRLGDEFVGRVL